MACVRFNQCLKWHDHKKRSFVWVGFTFQEINYPYPDNNQRLFLTLVKTISVFFFCVFFFVRQFFSNSVRFVVQNLNLKSAHFIFLLRHFYFFFGKPFDYLKIFRLVVLTIQRRKAETSYHSWSYSSLDNCIGGRGHRHYLLLPQESSEQHESSRVHSEDSWCGRDWGGCIFMCLFYLIHMILLFFFHSRMHFIISNTFFVILIFFLNVSLYFFLKYYQKVVLIYYRLKLYPIQWF